MTIPSLVSSEAAHAAVLARRQSKRRRVPAWPTQGAIVRVRDALTSLVRPCSTQRAAFFDGHALARLVCARAAQAAVVGRDETEPGLVRALTTQAAVGRRHHTHSRLV